MHRILVIALIVAIALVPGTAAAAPNSASKERCFPGVPEITSCISGPIRDFWERNGGLSVFGYPLTGVTTETGQAGAQFQAQLFERFRIELRADSRRPLLSRLGVLVLARQGRDPRTPGVIPAATPLKRAGCIFVAEAKHNICEPFLSAYRRLGVSLDTKRAVSAAESKALFGLPLTEAAAELTEDGQTRTVQWFERARMERHGAANGAVTVLLGRVGAQYLAANASAQPTSPAEPAASASACAPLAPPQNITLSADRCLTGATGKRLSVALPFAVQESFGMWLTESDGTTIGFTPQRASGKNSCATSVDTADAEAIGRCPFWVIDQSASEVKLDFGRLYPGRWTISFQSTARGLLATLPFEILGTTPAPSSPCFGVPTPVNGRIVGPCGDVRSLFKLTVTGFAPGEALTNLIGGPGLDGRPIAIVNVQDLAARADGTGVLVAEIPDALEKGDYTIIVTGASGRTAGAIVRRR